MQPKTNNTIVNESITQINWTPSLAKRVKFWYLNSKFYCLLQNVKNRLQKTKAYKVYKKSKRWYMRTLTYRIYGVIRDYFHEKYVIVEKYFYRKIIVYSHTRRPGVLQTTYVKFDQRYARIRVTTYKQDHWSIVDVKAEDIIKAVKGISPFMRDIKKKFPKFYAKFIEPVNKKPTIKK